MERLEVLQRLCKLVLETQKVHKWEVATDCFCGEDRRGFQFDETPMRFIEDAVRAAVQKAVSQ